MKMKQYIVSYWKRLPAGRRKRSKVKIEARDTDQLKTVIRNVCCRSDVIRIRESVSEQKQAGDTAGEIR